MTERIPPCRWIASDEPRAVIGEHYDACDGTQCRGCWPCNHDHCLICRREHCDTAHPYTCASCVGTVRDDLELVADMYARLRGEAISRSMSGDHEGTVLGGDAMVMLAMRYREQTGLAADGDHSHESDADPVPPLLTLATWEDCWRDHLGHDAAEVASVEDSARYLDAMLSHMAQEGELPFDDFARDIRRLRGRLEDVLHDGIRDESGAPCPKCRESDDPNPPALIKKHNRKDTTGASDRWTCRRCKSWWSEADYRLRVGTDHIEHAAELTASDMVIRTRVAAGTIRRWASKTTKRIGGETVEIPPRLKACGRSDDGRKLYRVADVLELRDSDSQRVA